MKTLLCVATAVTLLCGCASTAIAPKLTKEQARAATYPPPPKGWQKLVESYHSATLKDPDSARYKDWRLYRAYLNCAPPQFGHVVSFSCNAKNSYGGYAGYQTDFYWMESFTPIPPSRLPCPFQIVDIVDGLTTTSPATNAPSEKQEK